MYKVGRYNEYQDVHNERKEKERRIGLDAFISKGLNQCMEKMGTCNDFMKAINH